MEWSSDQENAIRVIRKWLRNPDVQIKTFGGVAGSGKTTTIAEIAGSMGSRYSIAFCAYTGKATGVLRGNLRDTGLLNGRHRCGTIHSMIYMPDMDPVSGKVRDWTLREPDEFPYDLIIADEASMIDERTIKDLKSFQIPILAVGDHKQLPPIQGKLNLMSNPDVRLEQVHRQARGNPIIELATDIREGKGVGRFLGSDSDAVRIMSMDRETSVMTSAIESVDDANDVGILCYKNRTRCRLNAVVRRNLGFEGMLLAPGDTVICLKNKKITEMEHIGSAMVPGRTYMIANGDRGQVLDIGARSGHRMDVWIRFDLNIDKHDVNMHQISREKTMSAFHDLQPYIGRSARHWDEMGTLIDYGYALTVHKAQGSQFEKVIVNVEWPRGYGITREHKQRWMYTAVTRAVDHLIILAEM